MADEEPNKWTRERSFLEVNLGDILMWLVCLMFLALTVAGFYFVFAHPHIPGLSEAFSSRPAGPPPDQKLQLAPGETEMRLYPANPKKPPEPRK
jgi:hypothetical protein